MQTIIIILLGHTCTGLQYDRDGWLCSQVD